jgi:hypothetical protein
VLELVVLIWCLISSPVMNMKYHWDVYVYATMMNVPDTSEDNDQESDAKEGQNIDC